MKLIFFAPHSAIWIHAFPEALLAESLSQSGHEIVYITCGRTFLHHCVAMSAFGLTASSSSEIQRSQICNICERQAKFIRNKFSLHSYDMHTLLTDADRAEIDRIVENTTPTNFLDIVIDDIEVGRNALSTFLLTHKLVSLSFTESQWTIFSGELHNTLLSFFTARKVFDQEVPDRVLMYSANYSVNLVWSNLATTRGIPFYSMTAGGNFSERLQKMLFARRHWLYQPALLYWEKYISSPTSPRLIDSITNHIIALLQSKLNFVYSPPKAVNSRNGIRDLFGIQPNQKVLLCTMSSYDEIVAAQACKLLPDNLNLLFQTQIQWVQALTTFVSQHPELFLIIRPHPREFPNKRDNVKSQHAEELESALLNLPQNAIVNWPTDEISLYDIATETDVCLNGWSSVGEEFSLLGIPVVIYNTELLLYPADLNLVGMTYETYFHQIEVALNEGWSIERSRKAYRWAALKYFYLCLDISDSYKFNEHPTHQLPLIKRIKNRIGRRIDPLYYQKLDYINRSPQLAISQILNEIVTQAYDSVLDIRDPNTMPYVSLDEETYALRQAFRQIANALGLEAESKASSLYVRLIQESQV